MTDAELHDALVKDDYDTIFRGVKALRDRLTEAEGLVRECSKWVLMEENPELIAKVHIFLLGWTPEEGDKK